MLRLVALALVAAPILVSAQEVCLSTNGWTTLTRSGVEYGRGRWGVQTTEFGQKPVAWAVPGNASLPTYQYNELGFGPAPRQESINAVANLAKAGNKLTAAYSVNPDIPTFHTVGGKTYIVNHFEFLQPATMYLSEVAADSNGKLRIVNTKPVDDRKWEGFWFTCSGTITPWKTHLGSEEYPPDCRTYEELFVPCKAGTKEAVETYCGAGDDGAGIAQMARYFGFYNGASEYGLKSLDLLGSAAAHKRFVSKFRCYNYGSTPEIKVGAGGTTEAIKWRTIGRFSHESALVMPDNKTVYSTDDNPNGVLVKFVADKAGDLNAGTLYAAKLNNQKGSNGSYTWDVTWTRLGYGKQSTLNNLVYKLKFSDMFETAKPVSAGKCPAGFSPANTANDEVGVYKDAAGNKIYQECLKIKKGMEDVAAFLETRRVASMKRATTEFEKKEGITYSNRFKQIYFADAKVTKGMLDNAKKGQYDAAGANDIRMEENTCGCVMAMDFDSKYNGYKLSTLLCGNARANTDSKNKCNLDSISDPDNLHYVAGNLIINEDSSQHENNVAWAYNLEDGTLTRILSVPRLAEVSGVWANVMGSNAYLSMAIQHPLDGSGEVLGWDTATINGQRGYMGAIGPMPAKYMNDNWVLKFEGIAVARTDAQKESVIASPKVCVRPANKAITTPKPVTA